MNYFLTKISKSPKISLFKASISERSTSYVTILQKILKKVLEKSEFCNNVSKFLKNSLSLGEYEVFRILKDLTAFALKDFWIKNKKFGINPYLFYLFGFILGIKIIKDIQPKK